MERRDYLKTAGGIGATTLLGGAGLLALSGGAAATAEYDYNEVTVTSDDGTVDYVAIFGDSIVNWDGFDRPAKSFTVDSHVELQSGDGSTLWTGVINESGPHDLTADSWGGDGETHTGTGTSGTIESDVGLDSDGNHDPSTDWAIVQASDYSDPYGLPANPAPASYLEVDGDGDSASFNVKLTTTYTWYANTDGSDSIYSADFVANVPVTVENEQSTATSSNGDGDDGAVGS